MNTLSYRGYSARVDFDGEDGLLVGKIVGIEDGVTFHAENVVELEAAFKDAVEDYLETCTKVGKTPEVSYSGRLTINLDPDLHRQAAKAAEKAGLDLTQWTRTAVKDAIDAGPAPRGKWADRS